MIPRSLLRQSRQLLAPRSTLQATTSSPLQQHLLSSRLPAPVRARIATRWFSDAQKPTDVKEETLTSGDGSLNPGTETKTESPLQKELAARNKEIIELKDKYLRQVAEFRNLQERTKRDMQAARDFAIQKFAKDLVESVDTFDLALSQVSGEKLEAPAAGSEEDVHAELRQLHGGLKMTEQVLLKTLSKHGLERFDPSEAGEKFNPNLHEATFQAPQPDKEDGTCFYTTQKGFQLNGRVLRAAKVGVVKNS